MEIELELVPEESRRPIPDPKALGFGIHFADHMFIMDYKDKNGWINPRIIPYSPFTLDPAAVCLHYGQAIFEGLKAYRGVDDRIRLFRPEENIKRLNKSAWRMCMPSVDPDTLLEAIKKLVRIEERWVPNAKGTSLYIRPFMIATEPYLGVRPAKEYILAVIMSPVGAYYAEGFNPVKIYVTDKYVRAAVGGVGEAKAAGNYAASLMASEEAKQKGFTQVLWLDAKEGKYVEEVGTMNIFFVINGELVTPELTGSILSGITRDSVIRLASDWGYKVTERRISIDEVFEASQNGQLDECFGTGTAAVISPVGSLYYRDKTCTINGGQTGPLAKRLFEELMGIQYGEKEDPYGWTELL